MRRRLAGILGVVGALYLASPYVMLWRLDHALRNHDDSFVLHHIDWQSVRGGLVTQMGDAIRGEATPDAADTHDLPPFGASFVEGMASHLVDDALQPELVVSALRSAADAPADGTSSLRWACFDGPASFQVELSGPGGRPVSLTLRLVGGNWRVVHAAVPPAMLADLPRT